MTLQFVVNAPVNVSAWKVTPHGSTEAKLQLGVGNQSALLSVEEAERVRDYLDKFIKGE
jgi:hypothetical protein